MPNMGTMICKARRFGVMVAAIAMAAIATTGCDVDADFSSPVVVDRISIDPDEWMVMLNGGRFEYFYFDVELPEINEDVFRTGSFFTFWKYSELHGGVAVDVQQQLPAFRKRQKEINNRWVTYTETISCKYEVKSMRIMLSRFPATTDIRPEEVLDFLPEQTFSFRIAIHR